jgi:hypothetical protein
MSDTLAISDYLTEVYEDWQDSRQDFPKNVYLKNYWPIPFFGNPATALVATVGVNPSSQEFDASRRWPVVMKANRGAWKRRLKSYFNHATPADDWFDPWTFGLAMLGVSYVEGTAAHLDVSYRPTKAMLKNPMTDRVEFRRMVERDAAWFFRLLLLCRNLRVLLTFGPLISADRRPGGLFGFLYSTAPAHGFKAVPNAEYWELWHEATGRVFTIHDADTPDEKCVTCRVVKNLHQHRDALRQRIGE